MLITKEVRSLKDALHQTIHRHPKLSVAAIAEEIGMAESYLYRAALPDPDTDGPDASGVRFPLKKLVPLIRATKNFITLDYMERQLGRVAIPLPETPESLNDLHAKVTAAISEFSDVMKKYASSIADGKISHKEAEELECEAYEAIQAIHALVLAVKESVLR
jgi:hypothetical protein